MKASLLLALVLAMTACERRTEVKLEGGNPPVFSLSGSGRLVHLSIYGGDLKPIWKIEGKESLVPLESLRSITYGVVPRGYKQVEPGNSQPPPSLLPGRTYKYYFFTVDAPHAKGLFEIRDGKATAVEGSFDCYEIRDGKRVPVECPE